MQVIFDALKRHLRAMSDRWAPIDSDTEGCGYPIVDFRELDAEIDAFAATFKPQENPSVLTVSAIDGPVVNGELMVGQGLRYSAPSDVPCGSYTVSTGWRCAVCGGVGANDPQECEWPVCGCDPYANKVISVLAESGMLKDDSLKTGNNPMDI